MHMHAIPSTGTLTEAISKNHVRVELDMYFHELMCIATSADMEISANTMHQYVVGPAALKNMMCMLSKELERGVKLVYLDSMEERVRFHKDVTIEHTDTIINYQAWHHFAIIDHCEDVEELVFQQFFKS